MKKFILAMCLFLSVSVAEADLLLSPIIAEDFWGNPPMATFSSNNWVPVYQTQGMPYALPGSAHITYDTIFSKEKSITYLGLTLGTMFDLNNEKVGFEGGFDVSTPTQDMDRSLQLNFKVALHETDDHPGIAVGLGGIGFNKGVARNDYYMLYSVVGKTLKDGTAIQVGYYVANKGAVGDKNNGLILSVVKPISDIFSLMAEYQGGKNSLGYYVFGFTAVITPNVTSISVGYGLPVDKNQDPITMIELDVNCF